MRVEVVWLLLAAGGCGKQISAAEPWYRAESGDVLVGRPFEVKGGFEARCEQSAAPFLAKNNPEDYGTEIVGCRGERTKVEVECTGPCVVDGRRVTPTAPGPITMRVTLTSRKHQDVRTFHLNAVVPDGFSLAPCFASDEERNGERMAIRGDGAVCVTRDGHVTTSAIAGGLVLDHAHPVTLSAAGRTMGGPEVDLRQLYDPPPSSWVLPPGAYPVELRHQALVSRVTIVISPSAGRELGPMDRRIAPPVHLKERRFTSGTDIHWYELAVEPADAGKRIRVVTTPGSPTCDPIVELFTGTNADVAFGPPSHDTGAHEDLVSQDAVAAGGRYWVKISWSPNTAWSLARNLYHLSITLE